MGLSNHPTAGNSTFRIEGRPDEHDAVIERQGQFVRLIQSRFCPCAERGRPDLHCDLCNGRGYIFDWQERYEVLEENSPHADQGDDTKLYPFWTPIKEVIRVQRRLHDIQGGNIIYTVASFTDDDITLVDNGKLAPRHFPIKVTYKYYIPESVTDEDSTSDGTYVITTTGTEIDVTRNTSNPFHVYGDIFKITRVYNVTQDETYTVSSFRKTKITLVSTGGAPSAPLTDDVLEVDYEWIQPIQVGIRRIEPKYATVKWGVDLKVGDIEGTFPGGYHCQRGNIVSLLSTVLTESKVIKRGAGSTDELPFFDCDEIIGDIIDVNGVVYTSADFTLSTYNDLVWSSTKPAEGIKYTVQIRYHPSYTLYKQDTSMLSAENKRWPQNWQLRLFDKVTPKEFDTL